MKGVEKMDTRKRNIMISALIAFLLLILLLTNPTTEDYIAFSEEQIGAQMSDEVEIERINFLVFSTYAPIYVHEYGRVHLGMSGMFFPISNGQFDYPWWLEFFN
jgi:hypothetical protein